MNAKAATGARARIDEQRYDVAVVGAGPAGLAAATAASERGLAVVVLDEHPLPGGQIYRNVTGTPLRRPEILDGDYWYGSTLVRAFERSGAAHVPEAVVWSVSKTADIDATALELGVSTGPLQSRNARFVSARAVILATGALERPVPIPGWTLPGVMLAGAAQLLLKTAAAVPSRRTVLAGSGPLLWLLAAQFAKVGVQVEALLDTTPRGRLAEALPHFPGFLGSDYVLKGLALQRDVRRRVKVIEHVTALAALGDGRLEAVKYDVDGRTATLAADLLLLHQGVVPDVNLANAIGCEQRWNDAQACFEPVVDAWGGTSVQGVYVAGDGAGIAGAKAAEASGRLTALAVANALGRIDGRRRDLDAAAPRGELARALRGRAFFETLYRPDTAFRIPAGDTIVCRCEEVTARQIVDTVKIGCSGPNQMKSFLRCGMGPCQGRFCGLTVTELIARERRVSPADVGYFRLRFPVKPVTLGELAELPGDAAAVRAVERTGGH